jgi:hypothetical protein
VKTPKEMSSMKSLLVLTVALLLAAPAVAGDCPYGDLDGFDCDNMCPLAKEANTHRSLGTESEGISVLLREELTQRVVANLARI